jgi:GDPmannose 4,6-dehydratase
MNKAIIVGSEGQDGRFLYNHLLGKGYEIVGVDMQTVRCSTAAKLPPVDISHAGAVADLIRRIKPDEVYYLAAFHHSSEDEQIENIELFKRSYNVHVVSLINFLEAITRHSRETRLFYASSSHIFGNALTADPAIVTKKTYRRIGNPRKLMELTGWKPSVDFGQMIRFMIAEEDQRDS